MAKQNYTIGEFKYSGENVIDVDLVIKKWNHLWVIVEWREQFRLIKYLRKDSSICKFKTNISSKQAKILIEKLNLQKSSTITRSGKIWK